MVHCENVTLDNVVPDANSLVINSEVKINSSSLDQLFELNKKI